MSSKIALLFVVVLIFQQGFSRSVDLNDPTVQRLARKAVEISNKDHNMDLSFYQVLSAEKLIFPLLGYFYQIALEAYNANADFHFPRFIKINDTVQVVRGKEKHFVVPEINAS